MQCAATVSERLKPLKLKCEQSSTGSPLTYPDEGLAASLRSRSLSSVSGCLIMRSIREASSLS